MRFIHHSNTHIAGIRDRRQQEIYSTKPKGFWISDEDANYGWSDFCRESAPEYLGELSYDVELNKNANILWLRTPEDIDAFTYCYRKSINDVFNDPEYAIAIDWHQLAQEYDGLIITPYQWTRRLGHPCVWYYGWDCASGCIWNKFAIQKLTLINS